MKYQKDTWTCGAAAVVNALRCHGRKVSEYKVRGLAGTVPDVRDSSGKLLEHGGTDHNGMVEAIRELGYSATEYFSMSEEDSWEWLHGQLIHGHPVILCVEAWMHWVVCAGTLGDRVVIINSSNFKNNQAENGVHVWDKDKLVEQWYNARKSCTEDHRLYAIAVRKKKRRRKKRRS
jgi:ABC-type bacteriocin/lantibiotic exporter with double-glycine peptidase domain